MLSIFRLPKTLQSRMERAAQDFLLRADSRPIDFTQPWREEALFAASSVTWRVFKNPIALFVGGLAGVILELANPAVRSGVWEHSSFQKDPLGRLRRTGLAAMVTVYGARSIAEPMIAAVARRHAGVTGMTPGGAKYLASDPTLLTWVHSTAAYGFVNAYSRYAKSMRPQQFDAFYREGAAVATLYGARGAPTSQAEIEAFFDSSRTNLEPSEIIFQFLQIINNTSILPGPLRWLQPSLVRAAVDLIPRRMRLDLGLGDRHRLSARDRWLVQLAGAASDRVILTTTPAVQSCVRLGLPLQYLYS